MVIPAVETGKNFRWSPTLENIKFFEPSSSVLVEDENKENIAVSGKKYLEKCVNWHRAERTWVCTEHGAAVLKRHDIVAIDKYTEFVKKTIKALEGRGIIATNTFIAPRSVSAGHTYEGAHFFQRKIKLIDCVQNAFDSVEEGAEVIQAKARIIAHDLAYIIWESGFADAHFGNIIPLSDRRWSLVDCKPFGLYNELGVMDESSLQHNGRIGIEKLRNSCQYMSDNGSVGFTEMVKELQRFLDANPLSVESCPICKSDLEAAASE